MSAKELSPNRRLLYYTIAFLILYFIPFSSPLIHQALIEAFEMLLDYVKAHVLFCLIPAFFIAGAITVFINQQSVINILDQSKKIVSYSVASVSGAILAVCSCTILPLFKGIYKKVQGLVLPFLFFILVQL